MLLLPKDVYLHILKLHCTTPLVGTEWSLLECYALLQPTLDGFPFIIIIDSIVVVAILLAHNNISQICYCGEISLQSATVFLTI